MAAIEYKIAMSTNRLVEFELLLELKFEQKHGTSLVKLVLLRRKSYIFRYSRRNQRELPVSNPTAARKAHISDLKDRGSFLDGCPKHVSNIVPSSSAKTNPNDPLSGIASPSVGICIFFVDLISSYISIVTVRNAICV
jgi:hypothetical protein